MNVEIYYFSGTGNSLIVARDIALKTKGNLIPIASLLERDVIKVNGDVIGIVFPVYYCDLPPIVKKFAEKLGDLSAQYLFAVCTYGGGTGNSFKTLDRIIRSRGGALAAQFGIHLPQNAFRKPWENRPRIFSHWQKKLERIHSNITRRKKGMLFSDRLSYLLLLPVYLLVKPMIKKGLLKLSNASIDLSIDELINSADKSFGINEKCNGCGICAKVCPVSNIEMINDKPAWLNRCENCLACLNWCPNQAIQGGVAQKNYYYRHPDVKISDIMKQKEKETPTSR